MPNPLLDNEISTMEAWGTSVVSAVKTDHIVLVGVHGVMLDDVNGTPVILNTKRRSELLGKSTEQLIRKRLPSPVNDGRRTTGSRILPTTPAHGRGSQNDLLRGRQSIQPSGTSCSRDSHAGVENLGLMPTTLMVTTPATCLTWSGCAESTTSTLTGNILGWSERG